MNYTLNQTAQLLDPISLTHIHHRAGSTFTPYWPPTANTPEEKVLLVLTTQPHTRALISQDSLDKHFTRVDNSS